MSIALEGRDGQGRPFEGLIGQPPVGSAGGRSTQPKRLQSPEAKLAEAIADALANRNFDIDFFAYMLTMFGADTSVDLFRVVLALFRQWGEDLDTGTYFSDDQRTVYEMSRRIVKVMQQPGEDLEDTQPLNLGTPNKHDILD